MTGEIREFSVVPDWRGEIPYWLLLPKSLLFIGVPVWIAWQMILADPFAIDSLITLGLLALLGVQHVVTTAERTRHRLRRLNEKEICVDDNGLHILPPYGEWRTFPWSEVSELQITSAGGLFGDGFMCLTAGGVPCNIPLWVVGRRDLLRQIRRRADLCRVRRSWWATVYRRDSIFTEEWPLSRLPDRDDAPA